MNRPNYEKYINNTLTLEDGVLKSEAFGENHIHIMSDRETEIMKRSAEIVAQSRGRILNVGFGMGIIDGFIRDLKPASHDIIESHQGLVQKAADMGFTDTCRIHIGDWREVVAEFVKQGVKFDGIYFDTIILDTNVNEWRDFVEVVDQILEKGGVFSYFNNKASTTTPDLPSRVTKQGYKMYHEKIPTNDPEGKFLPKNTYYLLWYVKQ
jgi:protein arginine N-methyltransferase 2